MRELLKLVFTFVFKLLAIFYGIKVCFWAMNKASTIGNLLGFLGLIFIGVYFAYEVRNIANKANQDL